MPEATNTPTTTDVLCDRLVTALMTMEDRIIMLRNVDGALCHFMGSASVIEGDHLYPVVEVLATSYKALEQAHETALAAIREIRGAHTAEIARLREELTPMSGRDVQGMRRFLRVAAETTIKTLDDLDAAIGKRPA